ncbi:MAG TPA: hypothetical protein VFO07_03915, partial [Roseiflexaceae bacterium]|nr:hypothetical protein [Roseiflexaceae bacterium]
FTRASYLFDESLTIFRDLDNHFGLWLGIIGRARIAAVAGEIAQAVRLCASVNTISLVEDAPASEWPPEHRQHYDRTIAAIRAQLDEATFAAAWAEGQQMPLEQAIAEALAITATREDDASDRALKDQGTR